MAASNSFTVETASSEESAVTTPPNWRVDLASPAGLMRAAARGGDRRLSVGRRNGGAPGRRARNGGAPGRQTGERSAGPSHGREWAVAGESRWSARSSMEREAAAPDRAAKGRTRRRLGHACWGPKAAAPEAAHARRGRREGAEPRGPRVGDGVPIGLARGGVGPSRRRPAGHARVGEGRRGWGGGRGLGGRERGKVGHRMGLTGRQNAG